MEFAESLLTLLAALGLFVTGFAGLLVLVRLRRGNRLNHAAGETLPAPCLPPLSILKPLRGVDEGLFENLAACARQDYPEFELILGCEDPNDPALDIAAELKRAFPHIPIEIVFGAPPFGFNPKVVVLAALAKRARYDHVVISDANVRPAPNYLRDLAAALRSPSPERSDDAPAGLVSSVLVGVGFSAAPLSLGSRLENLQFNSFVASAVVAADALGQPCVVGKSMLFRMSNLEKLGGFAAVADLLAEDYEIGRRFHALGFRVALAAAPLAVHHERRTVAEFWGRHLRWAAMRRCLKPWTYWGEPLLNPLPLCLASGLVSGLSGFTAGVAFAALGVVAKIALDLVLGRSLEGSVGASARRRGMGDVLAIVLKDFLALTIWTVGLFRSTVDWRGHRLRIGRGSRLSALDPCRDLGRDLALDLEPRHQRLDPLTTTPTMRRAS